MANYDELERLGERFPNKNVGCGNPNAKILVVTQKVGNEVVDYQYLKKLFKYLPWEMGEEENLLEYCYYIVYDEDILADSFFARFKVIVYTFIDGSQLHKHNPAKLLGMEWISECTVEDGAIQRLFVAHSKADGDKPERIMLCTYPFEKVYYLIGSCCQQVDLK